MVYCLRLRRISALIQLVVFPNSRRNAARSVLDQLLLPIAYCQVIGVTSAHTIPRTAQHDCNTPTILDSLLKVSLLFTNTGFSIATKSGFCSLSIRSNFCRTCPSRLSRSPSSMDSPNLPGRRLYHIAQAMEPVEESTPKILLALCFK